ncbi:MULTISPECIES: hypothetical protein [Mumia]|uniref:hypothetical protein n=1 Tax=Mumia TaxID=1546255 RepID=UPI00142302ED|nr:MULTISPECIES: hypothetical protein [unclassified Mumia]QMW65032.1 hypothetical protein H4N58_12450 [Mumia sp. ZJ1417]
MRRTLRTLAVGAAVSTLVVGAAASPAVAKTRSFKDARGDATAAVDMTKIKVANKKRALVVRITVPELKKSELEAVTVTIVTKARARPLFISSKARYPDGPWSSLALISFQDESTVRCRGDRIRFGARAITVRIPQRCLDRNRKPVRVSVSLVSRQNDGVSSPQPGPDTYADGYPSLVSPKQPPWVRYR